MVGLAFYGVIDLLSVLPYYLELLMQQDTVWILSVLLVSFLPILHPAHVPSPAGVPAIPLQPSNLPVSSFLKNLYLQAAF